ncbi:hypothetical protein BN946_scf184989.g38 [Trametes cinnabarina]|uniref:MARVEL domain-containing protein n=1 Tax=Pycnoporus cinnabarinus TaxID=5643 RepID=A0A060S315_PYCCI|nr:hypothetical protein BN946_scf184989.g38 [Trametes cinnabarina]
MNVLWLYRVSTLILVSIVSLAVIGLCVHTSNNLAQVLAFFGLGAGSFPYTTLGIAVSAITLVSSALLIALDIFFDNIFTSYLAFEIPWLSILWILWISVGWTTLSEGHMIFQGITCSLFTQPNTKEICEGIHPIAIIAFINFALLFLYTGVLMVVAFTSSSSYSSPWTSSLKSRNK